MLSWDQLSLTERCVESLRSGTDVPFELIIVDNGSEAEVARRVEEMADRAILNPLNRGFAAGMNQGLAVAAAPAVAFVNNDTVFPEGWAGRLLEHLDRPGTGLVAPVVTAAGNPVTVRESPGDRVITLVPYADLPSGVVYVMRTALCRELGGWNEDYPVASGEDLDLLFTIWANDLDVIVDERVLVEHESQGTVAVKLPAPGRLYEENLERFIDRWSSSDPGVPRVHSCPAEVHARNLRSARAAATWLGRLVETRRALKRLRRENAELQAAKGRRGPFLRRR